MKLHYLVAAIVVVFVLAVPLPARGETILPNLPVGSQYELAFVTRGGTNAMSPYIADYNAFVTAQALQNPNLPQGIAWNAIASAAGDIHGIGMADANQNAPFTSSIPVYNTVGQLVANASTPLYGTTGILINAISYDQFGNSWATPVWTGSNTDGMADKPLGGQQTYGAPYTGYSTATNAQWIHGGTDSQVSAWPLYALSSPITVITPEPSTLALLAAAAASAAALRFFRRRRATSA